MPRKREGVLPRKREGVLGARCQALGQHGYGMRAMVSVISMIAAARRAC